VARTGRRPGNQDTREAILDAARHAFAERGYDGASIRAIATSAGVDPALVLHYFGSKDKLFLETVGAPLDPSTILPQVFAGGVDGIGERIVRTFLSVWDSPRGKAAVALFRSAVAHDWSARMLREFMVTQILRRAMRNLDLDPADAPLRASLVASQISGLVMIRYILRIEPLASAPPEVVVAAIAPTIQRYLTGQVSLPETESVGKRPAG
jgi:AcrR family transcriptional regulator